MKENIGAFGGIGITGKKRKRLTQCTGRDLSRHRLPKSEFTILGDVCMDYTYVGIQKDLGHH